MRSLRAISLGAVCLAGCTNAIESGPLTISFQNLNENDVREIGILERDEDLDFQSDGAWTDFVRNATEFCGGPPANFEFISAQLSLDAERSAVSSLEEALQGVTTLFLLDGLSIAEAPRVDLAAALGLGGVGPVPLEIVASRNDLAFLREQLLTGDFRVGLRAETDLNDEAPFALDLRLTFEARALCR